MTKICVKPSPIHGQGLFASEPIRAGETILDWSTCAETLTDERIAALPVEERRYLSVIEGRNVLFKPPARFVNHSCQPNAHGQWGRDVALRDIEPREEITVDYQAEQVPGLDLECSCGSPTCRGRVTVIAGAPSDRA